MKHLLLFNSTLLLYSSAHNGSIGLDSNRRISSRSLPESTGLLSNTSQIVTVVVRKDENGYGMKVSGDNPVFVQSVRGG